MGGATRYGRRRWGGGIAPAVPRGWGGAPRQARRVQAFRGSRHSGTGTPRVRTGIKAP